NNVELPMMYAGMPPKDRRDHAMELLQLVDMTERAGHMPNELSGGQKQRVAIARAMANDPAIILADEPTGALDSRTGRLVMDLFHKLHKEQNKTIVLITHNNELAAETDRIITIADGNIINDSAEGTGGQAFIRKPVTLSEEMLVKAENIAAAGEVVLDKQNGMMTETTAVVGE
ncbi:MAG: ATP-binding cassette domain-containing protein, partial [Oscillospiraceae bacterium]|nr:ATP-binding cassette domain-containing protein [Oscillospiraceae bacterium]